MQPSLINAALRSFFISLFAVVGICAGLIPLFILFAIISESEDELEVKSQYSATVIPNGDNIRKVLSNSAPVILVVKVSGMIGMDKLNTLSVREQLIESREGLLKNNRVKAVLLYINTPGGTVTDADGIYHAVKEYKEMYKVPVYAYVDGICASGGMYVAVAADQIYASEASIVGSIGVISPPFFNVSEMMGKIGVGAKTLYAGKGKDDLSPFRSWKEGEDESIKAVIDNFYIQFIDIVTTNRPELSRNRLINEFGAQVFPAEKGVEHGFIDHAGSTMNDTLKALAKKIGIQDDYYQVVQLEKKFTLSDLFKGNSLLMKGSVTHKLHLSAELDPDLMNQFLYLYLPNR